MAMHIEFEVDLKPVRRTDRPRVTRSAPVVPAVVRLLVLAHQIEGAIDDGRARDYADIARQLGVTRARVTQIVNLLLLAPDIQTAILTGPPGVIGRLSERRLRRVVEDPDWQVQRRGFDRHIAEASAAGAPCTDSESNAPHPRQGHASAPAPAALHPAMTATHPAMKATV